jgi:hypothetical protein
LTPQFVGWAKRSVPTIQANNRNRGGHGAKSAFAHPTASPQQSPDSIFKQQCRSPDERSDIRGTAQDSRISLRSSGLRNEHASIARGAAGTRVVADRCPSKPDRGRTRPSREGAGKTGCALHPRSHVHVCAFAKSAHEHTGSAESIRPSLRNGVTAYIVLSPVSRAFLPPSPCEIIPHNLTPASGRQDHTTLPSASLLFVNSSFASIAPPTQRS